MPVDNALDLLLKLGEGESQRISESMADYFTTIAPVTIQVGNTTAILIPKLTDASPVVSHEDLNTHYVILLGDRDPSAIELITSELEKGQLTPSLVMLLAHRDEYKDWSSGGLKPLVGCIVRAVYKHNDEAIFFEFDDRVVKMYHEQDCCENVTITDITGDLNDLVGYPLLKYDEKEMESSTWTFYKFASRKGYVDIRWYGSSNGYYSESVDFATHFKRLTPRLETIQANQWDVITDLKELEQQTIRQSYRSELEGHDVLYIETDKYIYRFYGGEQFGDSINILNADNFFTNASSGEILKVSVSTGHKPIEGLDLYTTTFTFDIDQQYRPVMFSWGGGFNMETEPCVVLSRYTKFN